MASLEQTLERLIAAIEAHTAVLATTTATQPTTTATQPTTTATQPTTTQPKSNGAVHPTTKRGPGRPPKAVAAPSPAPTPPKSEPEPDDGGLDGDDFGSDDDLDDGGLGDEPALGSTPAVTPEEAKKAIFSFRDALIARDGKDKALAVTRTLLHKHVKSVDQINEGNAAVVYAAFSRGE